MYSIFTVMCGLLRESYKDLMQILELKTISSLYIIIKKELLLSRIIHTEHKLVQLMILIPHGFSLYIYIYVYQTYAVNATNL